MSKIIDILMMILLLLVMAYPFTGQSIHIILGIMMVICFFVHHYLNRRWYLSLFKGKMTPIKALFIGINSLLLICVLAIALSGLTLADYIPLMSYYLARKIHLVCSYWSYLLMGLHVGLHVRVNQLIKNKIVVYVLLILGVILFIKNQFIVYLFHLTDFLYVSDSMNIVLYIIEYFIIFILFVILMNEVIKELRK